MSSDVKELLRDLLRKVRETADPNTASRALILSISELRNYGRTDLEPELMKLLDITVPSILADRVQVIAEREGAARPKLEVIRSPPPIQLRVRVARSVDNAATEQSVGRMLGPLDRLASAPAAPPRMEGPIELPPAEGPPAIDASEEIDFDNWALETDDAPAAVDEEHESDEVPWATRSHDMRLPLFVALVAVTACVVLGGLYIKVMQPDVPENLADVWDSADTSDSADTQAVAESEDTQTEQPDAAQAEAPEPKVEVAKAKVTPEPAKTEALTVDAASCVRKRMWYSRGVPYVIAAGGAVWRVPGIERASDNSCVFKRSERSVPAACFSASPPAKGCPRYEVFISAS